MKYLVTILFCLSFLMSQAQEPVYTPMRGNYKFKGIKIDTLLLIPSFSDTSAANSTYLDQVAGSMIRTGNDFWMRNANATAWLQNVNVGPGTSPVMNFVNEVFKKYGTDSVFYIVAPSDTFFAFKDGGGTHSPDLIDGSATQTVKADLSDYNLIFDNVDTLLINNSNKILITTDNRIEVDFYSNANAKTKGYVQFAQGKNNIDLSVNSDTIYIPGTFVITNYGQPLYLPKADEFQGQTINIINRAGAIDIYALGGNIYDQTGSSVSQIQLDHFAILSSDGTDWWIYNAY